MRVLLLGGTGAMGSHLATLFSDRGDNVIVTSRSYRESKKMVNYVKGNAMNLEFLHDILSEKWDAIIDFMVYTEEEFSERVGMLLDATSRYVFLSSARVYNYSESPIREESNRLLDSSIDEIFLDTNEYSLSKARQENILFASDKKNWTIVRPYITYSEQRFQLGTLEKENWLYRALKGRTIVFSEDMNNHLTTLTYGFDVANAIMNLVSNPKSIGEIYHVTNDNAYRWSEILDLYLNVLEDELGKRPKVRYQGLNEFLLWNPVKYQIIYDRLFDRRFDNTKLKEVINTEDFVEISSGIKYCLSQFLLNPRFGEINWRNEAIKDRFTKEKTPLKEIKFFKQKLVYILYRYFYFK